MSHSPRGSLWHRWDLHFHTPSSFDYEDKSISNQQIVDSLVGAGVEVVAVTDHHKIDIDRVRSLQEIGKGKLIVLPGVELRSELGGKPIHYIAIFPEDSNLEHVWTTLQGSLGLTPTKIQEKGGDHEVYVPLRDAAPEVRRLGGVISIHAGAKSNSIEEISNREQFQRRIKYDITKDFVDLMEIGQLKDIDQHLEIVFPATGLDKPLIICSDSHKATEYTVKSPLWLRCDPTFRGLLMVLREPRERVYIGDTPPDIRRVEQNRTKYIREMTFAKSEDVPEDGQWFGGSIPFNHGLVAIVGNKGSGKSALADTLGLLGATKNADSFSFLSKNRFRHPTGNLAGFFQATIEWESGETSTKSLADAIAPEEVERIKYLPQEHVERICNELTGVGEQGFERELKAVIFSHVPEANRLGHDTLDELVRFKAGEKQMRIDSLLKQLRETSRSRATLEAQGDPITKRELDEKIQRKESELEAHDKAKPVEVLNPGATTGPPAAEADLLKDVTDAEATRKSISDLITTANETIRVSERRHAVASNLLEKLANFQKDFDVFKSSIDEEATELGLNKDELVAVTISDAKAVAIRDETLAATAGVKESLESTEPPGLLKQLTAIEATIVDLQSKLDAPNRAYQSYSKALVEWEANRTSIIGTEDVAESLKGLQATLAGLAKLPEKIKKVRDEQIDLALQIHAEKAAQAEIYRTLYGPVQQFIDAHVLASDKLRLEFRAELTCEDFASRLLDLLALNRRGSFMGIDEGRARADALDQATKWGDAESVRSFLNGVDNALHVDEREGQGESVQLRDQLSKGKKPEEVYDVLYGLEYTRPRYILRWEGKDLSMLSPGERGTLLLVFYLLVDKSDLPLVIDQPEGNLDNHTVAKVLVECIKEARKRRQVVLVTHNPNLAVVCDADQVIHASIDRTNGNRITYVSGALENPDMIKYVTDVLEGTRWAFDVRGDKYDVGA